MKNKNGIYRKYLITRCPMCGKDPGFATHGKCKRETKESQHKLETLWVDISNGKIVCDACDYEDDISTGYNQCICGAVFSGAQMWEGMLLEYKEIKEYSWFKALKISKGSLETKFVGWRFQLPEKVLNSGYRVKSGYGFRYFQTFDEALRYLDKEELRIAILTHK